jgi:hypothetical protein
VWVKGFGLANGFMMMGVAFVLERSGVVVNSQTVADEDATEVFSEHVAQEFTSAALSDDIEGEQLGGKNPQPPARAAGPRMCYCESKKVIFRRFSKRSQSEKEVFELGKCDFFARHYNFALS